jgi:hypothetical protein
VVLTRLFLSLIRLIEFWQKKRKEKKKMASPPVSSSASSGAQVLRCLVLFNGTNYCDWVPHMRLHMRDLRLWEFLGGELPCLPLPTHLMHPIIPTGTSEADQKKPQEYDDIASYISFLGLPNLVG